MQTPPKLSVVRSCFSSREEALADCAKHGFTPTLYVSTSSPELPLHFHAGSTIGYVIEVVWMHTVLHIHLKHWIYLVFSRTRKH